MSQEELEKDGWVWIGKINVDSGLVMLGDPCYVSENRDYPHESHIIHNWRKFCDAIFEDDNARETGVMQLKHPRGHTGLGLIVKPFNGDGSYSVYARFSEDSPKRPKEIRIIFE